MKTVNFLDAVEANKTRRVRVFPDGKWHEVGAYRLLLASGRHDRILETILYRWQIEAEKFEFECEWAEYGKVVTIDHSIREERDKIDKILSGLIGKGKTKVTIEIIE